MIHMNRCSACKFCGPFTSQFPAGTCNFNGIVLKMTPAIRQWVDSHGCCTFKPCALIDADTNAASVKLNRYMDAIANTPFGKE